MALIKAVLSCSLFLSASVHSLSTPRNERPVLRPRSSPVVTVKNGSYEGIYSSEHEQDFFLGMRYAQPAERFSLAQPLNSTWNGTTAATSYPPHCVGYGGDNTGYAVSEDCLFLNVIRPAGLNDTADLPVAVWIHGGGLYMGGSADKRYNLSFIVENSVELGTPMIGVSLNYRLTAFGFLAGSEALDAGIANNGFRDQRLALRWINENIASFGGSPDKVTIFGESSGAESVSAQVLAYNGRDEGLFRAVIAESGFGGAIYRYPGGFNATDAFQATYNLLVSNTSCASTVDTPASLDCLRALPFEEINAALNGTKARPWPPMLDGDFIADYPSAQLTDGRFPQIPIVIGCNVDEGSTFGAGKGPNGGGINTDEEVRAAIFKYILNGTTIAADIGKTDDDLLDELMRVYPNIQAVGIPSLEKFPAILPGDALAETLGLQSRRSNAFFGDLYFYYAKRRSSIAWSNAGLPSYAYTFDVTVNGLSAHTAATHFQEVAFVFDNLNGVGYDVNPFANTTDAYPALAKSMSNAWVNFVTGLDPNGPSGAGVSGVEWPIYNATSGGGVGKEIVFDTNGTYVQWDSYRAEGINWLIENSASVLGN